MMERTDRDFRYLVRLICRRVRLYTEMVTAAAVVHGDRGRLLAFDPAEHPVALQLGGSDPALLGHAAALGEQAGYDEINLNVGCPSERVQSGRFGACLMAEPALVAECVRAMREACTVPVTVKTRIGIDDHDHDAFLDCFVEHVAAAGCDTFIVHARKAWLEGLSPKQNREVPPLDYERVIRLKAHFPSLRIVVNGGITGLPQAQALLRGVDGVMLGREAYRHPWVLADADERLFDQPGRTHSRADVVAGMVPYVERRLGEGAHLAAITRHLCGLYAGQPHARAWRRALTEGASHNPAAGTNVLFEALRAVSAPDAGARVPAHAGSVQ